MPYHDGIVFAREYLVFAFGNVSGKTPKDLNTVFSKLDISIEIDYLIVDAIATVADVKPVDIDIVSAYFYEAARLRERRRADRHAIFFPECFAACRETLSIDIFIGRVAVSIVVPHDENAACTIGGESGSTLIKIFSTYDNAARVPEFIAI